MKQVTELKEGEIYKAVNKTIGNEYIFTANKTNGYKNKIYTESKFFNKSDSGYFSWFEHAYNVYEATPEEKQWLEACEKAGKYLPKEEAIGFPDKWYCLYSSREEFDVLNKYCNNPYGYVPEPNKYGFSSDTHWVTPDYYKYYGVKITFQQFKEHVLKEKTYP